MASVIIPRLRNSGALSLVTLVKEPSPLLKSKTPEPGKPYESEINLSPTNRSKSPSPSTSDTSTVPELKKSISVGSLFSLKLKFPFPSLMYNLSSRNDINLENSTPPFAVYKSRSPSPSASKKRGSIVSLGSSSINSNDSINLRFCSSHLNILLLLSFEPGIKISSKPSPFMSPFIIFGPGVLNI